MANSKHNIVREGLNSAIDRMMETDSKEELLFQMRSASQSVMELYNLNADRIRGHSNNTVTHTIPLAPCTKCNSKARVVRASTPGYYFARCTRCENQSSKVFTTPRNAILDWNIQQEGDTNV